MFDWIPGYCGGAYLAIIGIAIGIAIGGGGGGGPPKSPAPEAPKLDEL